MIAIFKHPTKNYAIVKTVSTPAQAQEISERFGSMEYELIRRETLSVPATESEFNELMHDNLESLYLRISMERYKKPYDKLTEHQRDVIDDLVMEARSNPS